MMIFMANFMAIYWAYEEKGGASMLTTHVGTKTGNKEKSKASNYICRPVEK